MPEPTYTMCASIRLFRHLGRSDTIRIKFVSGEYIVPSLSRSCCAHNPNNPTGLLSKIGYHQILNAAENEGRLYR